MIIRTKKRTIHVGHRTMIMGILNITPDSFYDGGKYLSPSDAYDQARKMAEAGADIIDIGGESSRPGSLPVSPEVELKRVIPVIEALAGKIELPISVDTTKASVARQAIQAGAEIINDISAFRFDPNMAEVIAETKTAVILMHMRGTPQNMQTGDLTYRDVVGEIKLFLQERMAFAAQNGIDPDCIILDPGLGFGKKPEDNLKLIQKLSSFQDLGRPILTGVSRKSFTRVDDQEGPEERFEGTAAAVTASILYGSHIVRVHDVAAMKKVAFVADKILRAGYDSVVSA